MLVDDAKRKVHKESGGIRYVAGKIKTDPGNDVSPNAAEKKPAGQDWRRPQREAGKRKTLPMQSLSRKNQILATSYSPTGFCSTIGAGELNCRVRDGNGCFLLVMSAGKFYPCMGCLVCHPIWLLHPQNYIM